MDNKKDFAEFDLASGGINSSTTSVVLATGGGARMPSVPFNATIYDATTNGTASDDASRERVRVTAISTDTLTVTRGVESTSAANHNTGGKTYRLCAGPSAADFNGATGTDNMVLSTAPTILKPKLTFNSAAKTSNYTVVTGDRVLFCDSSSGDLTLTLPSAASNDGMLLNVKKTSSDANLVIIGTEVLFAKNQTVEMFSDGTSWLRLSAPYSVTRYLAADVDKLNTTLGDVLSIYIQASRKYRFSAWLDFEQISATANIKVAMDGPASPTALKYGYLMYVGSSSVNQSTVSTAYATAHAATAGTTGGRNITLAGSVENGSTAGLIKVQFAQNVTDASNRTSIKAGSWFNIEEVT